MAMGVNGTRCSKALFMGLIITGAVYALLALNQVFRVDLSFLRNAQDIHRLYVHTPRSDLAKNSSSSVGKLLETIKLLETRLATGARQQLERESGAKGRPSDGRRRQVYTDLTAYPFKENLHYHESTCPKTIASLAQYSKWFKYRYRPKVKVFLDKEDLGNFSDIFKHVLPFGYKQESKDLLTEILAHQSFTNAPLYPVGSRKQCIRCAVVGCGGILKESGAGPEIDSHDYVFRLNYAVSAGSRGKDVGRKTSFYIFFPESMSITSIVDKDAIYIYTMFKTYDMNYAVNMLNKQEPPEYIYNKGQKITLPKPNVNPAKLKIVHPDFFRYVFAEYLDSVAYRPTTGAMVVFLALHICDEVTIYGFGYDSRFTMHYYDTKFIQHTDVSTGSHDVDNERHLWQKLHDEGVIRLFKRDPY